MAGRFAEMYTLSLPVIPASRSVSQESEKARTTLDTFGRVLNESLRQLDLFGASLRTSPDTLPLDTPQFTEAYEIWVTRLRRDCLRRQRSGPRTDESDCSSWRSPAEQEPGVSVGRLTGSIGHRMYDKKTGRLAQHGLSQQVNLLPDYKKIKMVPTAMGDKMRPETSQEYWKRMEETERNWPTPQAGKHKGQGQRGQYRPNDGLTNKVISGLQGRDSPSTNGKSRGPWATPTATLAVQGGPGGQKKALNGDIKGKLNPDWVCQLMGLPVGWVNPEAKLTNCDC